MASGFCYVPWTGIFFMYLLLVYCQRTLFTTKGIVSS